MAFYTFTFFFFICNAKKGVNRNSFLVMCTLQPVLLASASAKWKCVAVAEQLLLGLICNQNVKTVLEGLRIMSSLSFYYYY